jgi:hypothetical protein
LILDVKEVWLDPKERIRQDYGDVKRMLVSLHKYGQLQAIRVRPPNEDEDTDGQKWVVVDGGRRMALELEYFANEDRKDFDWKERANFIRRIHEGHLAKDKDWDVQHTAALLEMGDKTVYKYLDFFQHPEAFQDESVQSALTFNVAYKQFQIAKEHAKRERVVAHREKRLAARKGSKSDSPVQTEEDVPQAEGESPVSAYLPPSEFAQHICNLGDCREWIEQIPDDTFEWAHWDPPYGGEQSGGAFARFDAIDDTWVYARMLMRDMLPHIWRVLKHGSWLALWYHPQYYHDIVMMLLGHEYDWEEGRCQHCDTEWETHKLILKTCKGNKKWRFWVNPYPNIWFKVDITRHFYLQVWIRRNMDSPQAYYPKLTGRTSSPLSRLSEEHADIRCTNQPSFLPRSLSVFRYKANSVLILPTGPAPYSRRPWEPTERSLAASSRKRIVIKQSKL